MDQFLDAMYGTRENIGATTDVAELEKNAEAELLIDALQKEGWDTNQIDNLSGEDILKVAHALFGENSSLVKEAMPPELMAAKEEKKEEKKEESEDEKDGDEKDSEMETAEEKVAEADKLGRQMAHAFVDEMSQLEKAAQYEQVKMAKAEQANTALQQASQSPAERVVAKVASAQEGPTEADLNAYIEQMANEKIAAMQLTPEQQLEAMVEQRVQEKLAGFQQA